MKNPELPARVTPGLYFAMRMTGNCPTRIGRMSPKPGVALAAAKRHPRSYVERYGYGVVWTPTTGWMEPVKPSRASH
jgi:hypothetical protein